ncbi:MAG: mechanosensitive ion channel, partial [Bacteroidales bacterium]|nr:mechanosensitive ion channel [Bacteroidales bacterium]
MKELLMKSVFTLNESIAITYLDVILICLVILGTIVLSMLTGRFIRRSKLFSKWELSHQRLLYQFLRISFWIIALGLVLVIIGLDINGFLKYPIVESTEKSSFSLTPRVFILAVIYIIITRLFLIGLKRVIISDSPFRDKDSGKSKSIFKFVTYVVWFVAFLLILNSTGLNLTILWGAGAALLVGVGFGLQQIIADLISGLFLLFEGNLKEGDVVELTNGIIGKVEHVGIRTSRVLTRDDYNIIIPNSQFIIKEVINWTHNEDNTRFHIDVGVAYGSDTKLVEKVLMDCAIG